ncbi:MAG: sulfurtransferase [Nitrospinota bacterium]|nr:sulfurtransferase [Nitrospinota bacterium]
MKPDTTSATLILSRKIREVLMALLGIFLIGLALPQNQQAQINTKLLITADTLKKLPPEQRVIIDTRSKIKFLMGHIPGSINLSNWKEFTSKSSSIRGLLINDENLISNILRSLGLDPEQSIIIYGDPTDPWRTDGRFFWMFERYGFTDVSILDGGIKAWKKIGEKLENGFQRKRKLSKITPDKIHLNSKVIADKYLIKNVLNDKSYVLIDNRTQEEYRGSTPYGSPRGGHIPNALHIHWPDFFKRNGMLKTTNELSRLLEKEGVSYGKEIVVYCTGGVRSAMAYFVFRYLGFKVRNYDGSWWDWSQDSNLPIEISG